MAKKLHSKHHKHKGTHHRIVNPKMDGHGLGSNIKLGTPEQTIHVKPSRRHTEKHAGTSEHEPDTNVFDSGERD